MLTRWRVDAGVVHSKAGKVRIVKRDELDGDWGPQRDKRLTVWEVTQHLIRAVEKEGESGAALLLRKVGGENGDAARELAASRAIRTSQRTRNRE